MQDLIPGTTLNFLASQMLSLHTPYAASQSIFRYEKHWTKETGVSRDVQRTFYAFPYNRSHRVYDIIVHSNDACSNAIENPHSTARTRN